MPIWPMPKMTEDITNNILSPQIPKIRNANTGSVAPASGMPKKLQYMSFIVFGLLKYLIQYNSYNIIRITEMIKSKFNEKLTPQNSENTVTKTSPILSKAKRILFSFLEYVSLSIG